MSLGSLRVTADEIAEATTGLDSRRSKLLSQTSDYGFEGIRMACIIAAINMLKELARRNHPPLVMKEISEQTILERREGDWDPIYYDPHVTGVQDNRTCRDDRCPMANRTTDERAHARDQLLHPKRFGEVVVGACIDAVHTLGP